MMMLAQKHSSPVIQVTIKQTETNPGLIGVVSDPQNGSCLHKPTAMTQIDALNAKLFVFHAGVFKVISGGEDSRRCC